MIQIQKPNLKKVVLGVLILGIAFFLVASGVFLLWASTLKMPTIEIIEKQRSGLSTRIYDKTGEVLLYDMHQDIQRTFVPLGEISDNVKHATIAIEDSGFYGHLGIEPLAIFRAIFVNLKNGDLFGGQGGSTITQQVVKNTLLVKEKKLSRKLKEWVLAIKLERDLTKDEILELYLNEIPYGGTKYGIEEASQGFFGKSAKDVTLAESAYLAALPQAPTYYSPYGNNRTALDARKNRVLQEMVSQGYITEEEYKKALEETVTFRPFSAGTIKAPHFVFYVIDQLTKIYGEEQDVSQANLKVITTLDWELQKEAERIVYDRAHENSEKYNASNASLMAIDPKTGGIIVMVGSRDYFDEEVDGNFNIGLAERQPGSSFKPFAYAAAIKKGYTSETVVYDVQTQFSTACTVGDFSNEGDCYSPGNYDDTFRGPMTFREALAQSVNVPAVKALYLAGMKETIELAQSMGVSTLEDWRRYGLTLVLGGGEVSLLDMTSAYGVFANEGFRHPYTSIREVYRGEEKDDFMENQKGSQVLDQNIARTISDMLSDNAARTPAFGADSYLHIPDRDVAVKTGTTNDYRDTWIIGYTPDISVGAWAGNNNNTAMEKKVAGFIVAPMWNEFMQAYFKKYPETSEFTEPEPLDSTLKGVLLGYKPSYSLENSEEGDSPATLPHSILHWVSKDDPRGPIPTSPSSDPQYRYWEYGVLLFHTGQEGVSLSEDDGTGTTTSPRPKVRIEKPEKNDRFDEDESITVTFTVQSDTEIEKVKYFVDDTALGVVLPEDGYTFSFTPKQHDIQKGIHTLLIIAYTKDGVRGRSSVEFRVR